MCQFDNCDIPKYLKYRLSIKLTRPAYLTNLVQDVKIMRIFTCFAIFVMKHPLLFFR